jgi:hypothetical protein
MVFIEKHLKYFYFNNQEISNNILILEGLINGTKLLKSKPNN